MKTPLQTLFMLLVSAAVLCAQNNGKDNPADNDPASHWASLQAAAKPPVGNVGSAAKDNDARKNQIAQQADNSRAVAASAKDFYTKYPTHANAEEARKIEVLAELRGIKLGDTSQEAKAMALAGTFRADRSHPQAARVEVAYTMDRAELSRQIKNGEKTARGSERLSVAARLRTEFGEIPEYHTYVMELARAMDLPTALRFATETSQSPVAPPAAKAQAKVIMDRMSLLGKPVNLRLTIVDGAEFDLSRQAGKITVVVAWSPANPGSLAALKPMGRIMPKDAQVVFLAMGGTEKQVKAGRAASPLPGTHCHAPAGPLSRAASDSLELQYSAVPRLYVLNRAGKLVGIGPLEDLPALLTRAAG